MVILRFLFNFAFNVLVNSILEISREFVVEKDIRASINNQPLEILNTPSLFSCAAECSKNKDCCSASYGDNTTCQLYTCCFPETISSIGEIHLRKRPYAEVSTLPKDCAELPAGSDSGVYTIYPTDTLKVDVYCDMGLENGTGWTVIQRRTDGSVNFTKDWGAYKTGFGDKRNEFWLGNDIINVMTTSKRYIIRFDMTDINNVTAYAEYDVFIVEDESLEYKVTVGCYMGTGGKSFSSQDGMKFSTPERDNDVDNINCAARAKSGWWFKSCTNVNANGLYQPGVNGKTPIYYRGFRGYTGLAAISMKIKPL